MSEPYGAALGAVVFLLAIAAAGCAAIVLRHRLPQARGRRLKLVDRLDLGERRFIAVVRLDDRELVLGGGTGAMTLLDSQPAPAPEPAVATPAPFVGILSEALTRIGRTRATDQEPSC